MTMRTTEGFRGEVSGSATRTVKSREEGIHIVRSHFGGMDRDETGQTDDEYLAELERLGILVEFEED